MRFSNLFARAGLSLFLSVTLVCSTTPGFAGYEKWETVVGEGVGSSQDDGKSDIGPRGGGVAWKQGKTKITIPPGALSRNIPITIKKTRIAVERDPESAISSEDFSVLAASELGPSGTTFARPAEVVMEIPPNARQQLNRGHQLVIAVVNDDITRQVTRHRIDDKGQVHFNLDHFSAVYIFAFGSLVLISLGVLAGRLVATDSPHIMIQPQHQNIRDFIRDGNVSLPKTINQTGTTDLGINKSLKGTNTSFKCINSASAVVKMKNGEKVNCQDITFLTSSIFLGSGDPRFQDILCVGGKTSSDKGRGDHMWVEVRIDGKIYAVDTINTEHLVLMPASEAYAKFNLKPTFEFGYMKRRTPYKGWTDRPTTEEPTRAQLDKAYKDGDEMGCRHQAMSPADIKAELREVYGNMTHTKIKEKFRSGYLKGGERCRPK